MSEKTNTYFFDFMEGPKPLPKNAQVKFEITKGKHILVRVKNGVLYVQTETGVINIIPVASNAFAINVREWQPGDEQIFTKL